MTIDALYAFSDFEVSISPNCCVIVNDKPRFLTVDELLRLSTENTRELLRQELEVKLAVLKEKLLIRTEHLSKYRVNYKYFNYVTIMMFNEKGEPVYRQLYELMGWRR